MHVPQLPRSIGCVFSYIYGAIFHPCFSKYCDFSPLFANFILKRRKDWSPTKSSATANFFFKFSGSWTLTQLSPVALSPALAVQPTGSVRGQGASPRPGLTPSPAPSRRCELWAPADHRSYELPPSNLGAIRFAYWPPSTVGKDLPMRAGSCRLLPWLQRQKRDAAVPGCVGGHCSADSGRAGLLQANCVCSTCLTLFFPTQTVMFPEYFRHKQENLPSGRDK